MANNKNPITPITPRMWLVMRGLKDRKTPNEMAELMGSEFSRNGKRRADPARSFVDSIRLRLRLRLPFAFLGKDYKDELDVRMLPRHLLYDCCAEVLNTGHLIHMPSNQTPATPAVPTAVPEVTRTKKTLLRPQIIKLTSWVERNREKLAGKPLSTKVRDMARDETGIDASSAQIRDVLDELGIEYTTPKVGRPALQDGSEDVRTLKECIDTLAQTVKDIRQELAEFKSKVLRPE